MQPYLYLFLSFIYSAIAREISFPPIAGIRSHDSQSPLQRYGATSDEDVSLETDPMDGLTSFAHLPHVSCFSAAEDVESYDIAVIGAPFDTGTSYRPGARFGPHGIRDGSRRIRPLHSWNMYTGYNPFLQWAKAVDCGDAPLTFVDNTVALKQLGKAHKIISNRLATNISASKVPRILMLGGDHTVTLAALRSTIDHWGVVNVIHFDSHIDTWDPHAVGEDWPEENHDVHFTDEYIIIAGGVSDYAAVNHGTFLHIAHEEGLISNDSSIHVGIRAPLGTRHRDIDNDARCGFDIIKARDIDELGVKGIIKRIRDRVGNGNVYVTVDIDVLDPAYAPATGTAEPGGWSTRELLSIIDGLSGLKVIGADVVEVSPVYDNTGETTCIAAGEVARSLIGLMVDVPVSASSQLSPGRGSR